jgi:hypothetical protein
MNITPQFRQSLKTIISAELPAHLLPIFDVLIESYESVDSSAIVNTAIEIHRPTGDTLLPQTLFQVDSTPSTQYVPNMDELRHKALKLFGNRGKDVPLNKEQIRFVERHLPHFTSLEISEACLCSYSVIQRIRRSWNMRRLTPLNKPAA